MNLGRNEDFTYENMTVSEMSEELKLLETQFSEFLVYSGYPSDIKYIVSMRDLIDIITRVDKREAYFYYFHSKMEINERKKVALYVYWILKFKPFRIVDSRYENKERENNINEAFSVYLICSVLFYAKKITSTTAKKEIFYKKLMYVLRFRDISLDALLLLIESMNTETFDKEYSDTI